MAEDDLLSERDRIESAFLADPPTGSEAFAAHATAIEGWNKVVAANDDGSEVRPWWVRRYWAKRSASAVRG
jgi:hypothetical protein